MPAISEKLNNVKISLEITPQNSLNLGQIIVLDSVDSTNSYLLKLAKTGDFSRVFCFAECQTQGRGRRGREWVSPVEQNIYCSLLWHFPSNQNMSGLSLALAVMVSRVIKKAGVNNIQLKWPNDVYCEGSKLAGILIESHRQGEVVIGVGINLVAPHGTPWSGIADFTDLTISRNQLAGYLANELLSSLPEFMRTGTDSFMEEWRSRDFLLNQDVIVYLPDEIIEGRMTGVDESGRMRLQLADGNMQLFTCGEVSVRKKEFIP